MIDKTVSASAVVAALKQMGHWFTEDGRVPPEVFDAMCEHLVTAPIELAVLRQGVSGSEVLMLDRHDRYFAGWHMPGSVILPGRNTPIVFRSLLKRELGLDFDQLEKQPELVDCLDIMKGPGLGQCSRGQEANRLYVLRLNYSESTMVECHSKRQFFPLTQLPPTTLPHHQTMIQRVLSYLQK